MRISILFFCFVAVLLMACRTQRATVSNYLEKTTDTTGTNLINLAEPTIQVDDLLSIKVYSLSADPRIDAMYNLPEQTVAGSTATNTAGFLVNADGNIEYPRLGTMRVVGLKKTELAQLIRGRLDSVLKSPTVIVRFLNYRISVLGEVRAPGTFNIPTERVTIFEALGLAGDITDFGNKAAVKIKRENGQEVSVHTIDLTAKDIFSSPFYRLQQNDVVFVEQNKRKIQQQEQQNIVQQVGIATGIITAIALIINIIR
jgi:polysaccharide biosynthesis/export protein